MGGPGEVAQRVKCLSCKHGDLSSRFPCGHGEWLQWWGVVGSADTLWGLETALSHQDPLPKNPPNQH